MSGIIYFPETQILGSGFRASACQSWQPKAKVRGNLIFIKEFGKTETFFLNKQQYKILNAVIIAVLHIGSKSDTG